MRHLQEVQSNPSGHTSIHLCGNDSLSNESRIWSC